MKTTILLTGASGFVGNAIRQKVVADNVFTLKSAVRKPTIAPLDGEQLVQVSDLDQSTDWSEALVGVNVVVHAAARVHVMSDTEQDPLAAFRRVNVEGTLNLARQAAKAGVHRFIFLSSIKVNGEGTLPGQVYRADDEPAPADPYGVSKAEAEQQLLSLGEQTGLEIVIIRPVLVYGPGVKANFLSMMRWLDRGAVLPFGAINNNRSLVALDNLIDLIVTCVTHHCAANQKFLVSDGEDLSTTELLKRMATALGKTARLVPIPSGLLSAAATALGKKALSQRLCGSLRVDISKTRELLSWNPPVGVDQALLKTAKYYRDAGSK
jgi:nucleoside-diphosphate-sugar epimerase